MEYNIHRKLLQFIIHDDFFKLIEITLACCRYAFSPLIDASDEEDEEETNFNSDAFGKLAVK